MNVLIVEADPANSSILRQLLKERAYDVTACATVAEAMKVFRETVFQLLFVDLCLPGRDGFSFCRWVRDQAAGDQPVILANTTSDRPADLRKILEAGADDYVIKPCQKELLDVRLIIARQMANKRENHRKLEENLLRERERLHYLATHDPLTKLPAVYDENDGTMAVNREEPPHAAEVKEAIRANDFAILFQPIVDVQTMIPALYEVLIRLPNNGELLQPSAFQPVAERYHLMPEIDRQVIAKAMKHLVNSNKLRLAINLSGQSFGDAALGDFIEASFKGAGVEPSRVTFEITETVMIPNLRAARQVMNRLRRAGFLIALDDFGAGFSSFNYLKNLIPDYLKMDGSFVRDAEAGLCDWTFVELINDVAHRLKTKSIAESVEQEATLPKLRSIGVDFAQGYYFGRPGPVPS